MFKLEVKFKKLYKDSVAPVKASDGAGAFDLTAHSIELKCCNKIIYSTGIAMQIPDGYVGILAPRSSVYKKGLMLSNSIGIIDSDYRGEIKAVFNLPGNIPDDLYKVGERCCQLLIVPIPVVTLVESNNLDETKRGTGGFGSTGNRLVEKIFEDAKVEYQVK